MLGVLYLLLCLLTGFAILSNVYPVIYTKENKTYSGGEYNVSPFMLYVPATFMTGVFPVTWLVYLLGNVFVKSSRTPLVMSNIAAAVIFLAADCLLVWLCIKNKKIGNISFFSGDIKACIVEIFIIVASLYLSIWLMYYTFHVKDGNVCMGYTVFSDFSPHMSVIRSFSFGNNFPTWYPYYSGIDIKYHFMFQFLAGNLEFLGMRLDHAFNVPSIISLVMVFMLIYVLTVKIMNKTLAGIIAVLLFAFRSSPSVFTFLKDVPEGEDAFLKLKENTEFLGYSTNENWGLWNLNVYANQRHLALCLAMMLWVLIMVMPYLYETFGRWDRINGFKIRTAQMYLGTTFFTNRAWGFYNLKLAVLIGLLAGMSAFFNGAALIALLMLLFFIAAFSQHRLDFVVMAGISGVLSIIQSHCFMQESSITPEYFFGFIAENKSLWGAADYIFRLTGILSIIVVASFLYFKGIKRYLLFVFAVPFIFSFTVSLTVDPTVNHKYIMMSCMLMSIMVAGFIAEFVNKNDMIRIVGALMLVFILTMTGMYDLYSIKVRNGEGREVVINLDDPVSNWIHENADSKDIFLTNNYTVNRVTMGGAMLYNGWGYFSWSAGYDTGYRDDQMKQMYNAPDSDTLKRLCEENNIRFIIVDGAIRDNEYVPVNEDMIAATFEKVYSDDVDYQTLNIYDTKKSVN